MEHYQVTSATKPNRYSSHEHITEIGNNSVTPCWRMKREDVIRMIDSNQARFFTIDQATQTKVYIYVVREAGKAPYIRTVADGKWKDNLLSLPDCYAFCKVA